MRLRIIGAVAAGTSAATRARRNDESLDIVIYEKDSDISYSGCGLPYYIGHEVENIEQLVPRDPAFFQKNHNIDIKIRHEVLKIDVDNKKLLIRNLDNNHEFEDEYDKLIIATGATSFIPPIKGKELEHVFSLRNVHDARAIRNFVDTVKPQHAVIVGSGFIGLEMVENLKRLNIDCELVELADQITPNLDADMAKLLENKIRDKGVKIHLKKSVNEIHPDYVVLSDGSQLKTEMVLLATGVRPNTKLATDAGIELGTTKAIKVNEFLETNIKDVYAIGDCAETFNLLTGQAHYRPLGSTANKMGRIVADVITNQKEKYHGNLGTGIYRVFDLSIASSGLREKEALELGYDIEVIHNTKVDKPEFMGGEKMIIKAIADRKTQALIGVQIVGTTGVDKRLDVFIPLMTYRIPVEDYFHLDLGYAPPFSTTKDPIHYTGMILDNIFNKDRPMVQYNDLDQLGDYVLVDARSLSDVETKGVIVNSVHQSLEDLRDHCESIGCDNTVVVYCNTGTTSNAAQNLLLQRGFKKVYGLSGGHNFYQLTQDRDSQ